MSAAIVWSVGGAAKLVSVSNLQVVVHSDKPFPPGAPVQGVLRADDGDRAFTLKVTGSRRIEDGTWEVRGRLVTATSNVIAAFARCVAPRE